MRANLNSEFRLQRSLPPRLFRPRSTGLWLQDTAPRHGWSRDMFAYRSAVLVLVVPRTLPAVDPVRSLQLPVRE